VFVIADFARGERSFDDPRLVRWSAGLASTEPGPRPLAAVPGEPGVSSPMAMSLAALATFALLAAIGYGWARWAIDPPGAALLAAPACGVAVLTVAAVAAERLGVPLDASVSALALSALAGGSGYVVLTVRRPAIRGDHDGPAVGEGEPEVGAPTHVS
jgi:hypothetical protein